MEHVLLNIIHYIQPCLKEKLPLTLLLKFFNTHAFYLSSAFKSTDPINKVLSMSFNQLLNKIFSGGRPVCSYGSGCYRKNPRHFEQESHPGDDDYQLDQQVKCLESKQKEFWIYWKSKKGSFMHCGQTSTFGGALLMLL